MSRLIRLETLAASSRLIRLEPASEIGSDEERNPFLCQVSTLIHWLTAIGSIKHKTRSLAATKHLFERPLFQALIGSPRSGSK